MKKGARWVPFYGKFAAGNARAEIEEADESEGRHEMLAVDVVPDVILDVHSACSARYANDAIRSGLQPNVEIVMDEKVLSARDLSWNSIFLRVAKDVHAGEEALTSYGQHYWSETWRLRRNEEAAIPK
jgi:SET domain-containing protein